MTDDTMDKRFTNTRHQISDWLLAEGWKLKDLTDKAKGSAWALEGTDPRHKVVIFAQNTPRPDALIMHPGPMNRGVEIDSDLADDINRSVIREQVEMGVAVRMACLEALTADPLRGRRR